jgi:cysteine desulfurase
VRRKPRVRIDPLIDGGGHERGMRSGTLPVPMIVGFGVAAELGAAELGERHRHLLTLRTAFERGLSMIPESVVHGRAAPRLPHTSHVAFRGIEGEALLIRLDLEGFAVSTGAACASGVVEPSPVLLAMGIDAAEALASIRVSFGVPNTLDEVERFLETLAREVVSLRELLPRRATS